MMEVTANNDNDDIQVHDAVHNQALACEAGVPQHTLGDHELVEPLARAPAEVEHRHGAVLDKAPAEKDEHDVRHVVVDLKAPARDEEAVLAQHAAALDEGHCNSSPCVCASSGPDIGSGSGQARGEPLQ